MTVSPGHQYKKSTFSTDSAACVEIRNDVKALRDSKNPDGSQLRIALENLLAAVKEDQFNR